MTLIIEMASGTSCDEHTHNFAVHTRTPAHNQMQDDSCTHSELGLTLVPVETTPAHALYPKAMLFTDIEALLDNL